MNNFKLPYQFLFSIYLFMLCINSNAQQLKANFSANKTQGCSPLSVNFTNTSTGNIVSYLWRFGNGNTSTLKSPGAIYLKAGKYTITLIVTDIGNNKDSITKKDFITVFGGPQPNFSVNNRVGCNNLNVQFSDKSKQGTGKITKWTWDFGDGTVSNSQNPSHSFISPGNYDITLFLQDDNGCTESTVKKKYIVVIKNPTVKYSLSDSAGCAPPLSVNFTDKSVAHTGGNLTYKWDFGDGNTSTQKNPNHKYLNTGSFDVKLTVTDTAGCSSTLTKKTQIFIGSPKPDFTYSSSSGCAPLDVTFSNKTKPSNNSFSYKWIFGDGGKSTQQNPSHTYNKGGNFSVTLIATSPAGCTDSITKSKAITVKNNPTGNFAANDTISCKSPFQAQFSNSFKDIVQYSWDFGDGGNSSQSEPVHTFIKEGKYSISLTVKNKDGCTSSIKKTDYIKVKIPEANFTLSDTSGCVPLTVDFKDSSVSEDPIVGYKWHFGDGDSSQIKEPTHTFDTGKFAVKLTITTKRGCKESTVEYVKTGIKTDPDFKGDPTIGCLEEMTVGFKYLLADTNKIPDRYYWEFGDGNTSEDKDPTHKYDVPPGQYTVTLTTFKNGCADTMKKKNYITILPPYASFSFSTQPCKRDSVVFSNNSVGNKWIWDFGDSTTSTIWEPVHQYKNPGFYEVKLTIWDTTSGCKDTLIKKIGVPRPFSVQLLASNPEGCHPHTVKFEAVVSDSATYLWNFGNGTVSTKRKNSVTYNDPGTFSVSLSAVSQDGCKVDIKKKNLVVTHGPVSDFSVIPISGCIPLKVKVTNKSSSKDPIVSLALSFDDGKIINSNQSTYEHTYQDPPSNQSSGYLISMIVEDSTGCKHTKSVSVYPTKPQPKIDFKENPTCDSVTYTFEAVNDPTIGLGPFTYEWNFDNKKYTSSNFQKTFAKKFSTSIILKLTDANGCTNDTTMPFNFVPKSVHAGFYADSPYKSCPPHVVKFTDTSVAGFAKITKWEWNFGDDKKSTKQNPEKLYLQAGKYDISLKVTDAIGCTDSITRNAFVFVDGPTGTYSFDTSEGCTPLTVNFSSKTQNASIIQWDLGDGHLKQGQNITHTYKRISNYIPLLILSDDKGCTYALPPIDTIRVFPSPLVDFSFMGKCFGYSTYFFDSTIARVGNTKNWQWDFGDGHTATSKNPKNTFEKPGFFDIQLIAENSGGCKDTMQKRVKIGGLKADFTTLDTTGCVGSPVFFFDKTFADTTIKSWNWIFGNNDTSILQNPSYTYDKKGIYDVELIVEDVAGCLDTIKAPGYLIIGDTVPPDPSLIYSVTVDSSRLIRINFSKYRDIDLDKYFIRREISNGVFKEIDSTSNILDTIYRDDRVNPLVRSYCYKIQVKNICDRFSDIDSSGKHCTVELTATPDTNSAKLNWNPYYGWSQVDKYEILRKKGFESNQYIFIDSVPGSQTQYVDSNIICYQNYFYKIRAFEKDGYHQNSLSDSSGARPIYVPHVIPTNVIRATVLNDMDILIEWKLTNQKVRNFYIEKSSPEKPFYRLDLPIEKTITNFIDRQVQVDSMSYTYRVQVRDSCGDLSPYSNVGKSILLKADITEQERYPFLVWSDYIYWEAGVNHYDVELKQPDGSFKKVGTTSGDITEFIDKVTNLNTYSEYCYRVKAIKNKTSNDIEPVESISNEDCVPTISSLFVPNVFSPNDDGINDSFVVNGLYIKTYHIKIYDRWGRRVFESDDFYDRWDGYYNGKKAIDDVYVFIIDAKGIDNKSYHFTGNVTLIK